MKVTPDYIQLDSLDELNGFVADLELNGQFQFLQPVVDNSDNVLIREGIYVKPAMLQRLESMAGQYRATFQISNSKEVLLAIRQRLAPAFLESLKGDRGGFTQCLFDSTQHNYRSYVRNAIRDRKLLLAVYRMRREHPEFFQHAASLAMLTLGILLHTGARRRLIHIMAFQSGLCADLALSEGDEWRTPAASFDVRKKRAVRSAKALEAFDLAAEVRSAIEDHPINAESPDVASIQLGEASEEAPGPNFFDDPDEGKEPSLDERPETQVDRESAQILTEVLRIARFIHDTSKQVKDSAHFAEELVYMVAYNAARGFFHKDIINPLLKVFRDYESGARRLMKIADIEARCKFPPSAWAYPKPRAAQILCRNHRYDCPWLVSGWDIHVISPHEAYGWIGVDLPAGNYQKCALNEELEKL